MLMPAMRAMELPLTLLVTGVGADHEHGAVPADDLALLAHRPDRRSYLHGSFQKGEILGSARRLTPRKARPPMVAAGRDGLPCAQASSFQGVSTRGPSAVTAMVNSKCAASDPSCE